MCYYVFMKKPAKQHTIETIDIDIFLKNIANKNGVVVLLHELEDPHNVGAIIRSSAAFGALGVIIPKRNQAPITETVVRTSVGTVNQIPIIEVANINTAIIKLQKARFWVYGLSEKSSDSIFDTKFDPRSVIIVGNEHSGIAQEALKKCDFKVRIPIAKNVDSLNASVSASLALYEWKRGNS